MQLAVLSEAIGALVNSDPAVYADAESVLSLHKELSRLEAFVAAATAAFDASGDWATDGAQSCVAWLAERTRLPKSRARRRVQLGGRLGDLPATKEAWLSGEVSEAHVAAIAAVVTEDTQEAFERDEVMLVGRARTMRFGSFHRQLTYWKHCADPDGAERDAEAAREQRDANLVQSFQGMWFGRLELDPVSGAIVHGELERIADVMFQIDWAEAKDRLGRDPVAHELPRTVGQRWADAFVEMASRSAASQPDARRPRPLFTVLVGYETLYGRICELAEGMALTPGALVPWLTHADIERAVFKSPKRVEVSATSRLFTGATRRSIEVRDRRCMHPYCDRPAEICQVDHIVPFSDGGPTTQENGRLLCGFHNRLRNQRPPPSAA